MSNPLLHALGSTRDLSSALRGQLKPLGLHVDDKLRAWSPVSIKQANESIRYVDGYIFYTIPIHDRKRALTVQAHRFFFVGESQSPSSLPANALGSECIKLAMEQHPTRIHDCAMLLSECGRNQEICAPSPVIADHLFDLNNTFNLQTAPETPQSRTQISFLFKPDAKWQIKRPFRTHWHILSYVLNQQHLKTYAHALRNALERAQRESIQVTIDNIMPSPRGALAYSNANDVVLVGVKGARGDTLDEQTQPLLQRLNEMRIPYRLFAEASCSNRFAPLDQIPHLCALAGGQFYGLDLGESTTGLAFIGIDLGHPPHLRNYSQVVVTVVSLQGHLLAYWKGLQPRDETIHAATLEKATTWVVGFIRQNQTNVRMLVFLRDGRIFPNEAMLPAAASLPIKTIVVECIKHPTPYLVRDGIHQAPAGTLMQFGSDESAVAFLQPPASINPKHIVHALKIRLASPDSQVALSQISAWIYGLCHAPTLGLRASSVPSPIYWANGLAAISPTNAQFAGLHHVPHN